MQKRVVLVTGAARGLGAAIATRFHAAGYAVAIGDIAFDAAQNLARELSADGLSAFALTLDVTAKHAFESARDAILQRWGRIDALINNAGASKVVPVMEITGEQFDQVINVNLRSVLFGCQVFGQYFADAGVGRIVNIASLAGQNGGSATGAHYAAAKGGVITLTKVFARPRCSGRDCQCDFTRTDGSADRARERRTRQAEGSHREHPCRTSGLRGVCRRCRDHSGG